MWAPTTNRTTAVMEQLQRVQLGGATDTQRHRLGSLTDSAADSARREQYRYGQEGGGHTGRGPKNYQRSDERIMDDVCERLTRDPDVDATHIEVSVQSGLVTLGGTVTDRQSKRVAEEYFNRRMGRKGLQQSQHQKVQRTDLLDSSDTNQHTQSDSSRRRSATRLTHDAA